MSGKDYSLIPGNFDNGVTGEYQDEPFSQTQNGLKVGQTELFLNLSDQLFFLPVEGKVMISAQQLGLTNDNMPSQYNFEEAREILEKIIKKSQGYCKKLGGVDWLDYFISEAYIYTIYSNKYLYIAMVMINPYLATSLIRSTTDGFHNMIYNTFSRLPVIVKKILLKYIVFDVDKLDDRSELDSVLKYSRISGVICSGVISKDLDYSELSDGQIKAILYEIIDEKHNKSSLLKRGMCSKQYLNRLLAMRGKGDQEIDNLIDEFMVSDYNKVDKVQLDEELLYLMGFVDDSNKNVKSKNLPININQDGDTVFNYSISGLDEKLVNQYLVQGQGFIDKLGEIQLEKSEWGFDYCTQASRLLFQQDADIRSQIIYFLLARQPKLAVAILRTRIAHVKLKKVIENLPDQIILSLLNIGTIIPTNIDGIRDSFMDKDQFSIIKVILLLPYDRVIDLINNLTDKQLVNLIITIFHLSDEKDYPSKNLRHIFKHDGIDQLKIKRALAIIYNIHGYGFIEWIQQNIIQDRMIFKDFGSNFLIDMFIPNKSADNNDFLRKSNDLEEALNRLGLMYEYNNLGDSFIFDDFILFLKKILKDNKFKKFKSDEERQEVIGVIEKALRSILVHFGLYKITHQGYFKATKKILPEIFELNTNNKGNINGKIKIITDPGQLEHLSQDDIPVLYDYPTTYIDIIVVPKAIIISKDSDFSHGIVFAKINNIPVFFVEDAEYMMWEYSNMSVQISYSSDTDYVFITPQFKNSLKTGTKAEGVEKSILPSVSINSDIQNMILKTVIGEDEFKTIPYYEISYLLNSVIDRSDRGSIQKVSKKVQGIIDSIIIDPDIIRQIEDAIYDSGFDFPIAFRSDSVLEDADGKRSPGKKKTFLNIRTCRELGPILKQMLKVEFSVESLLEKNALGIGLMYPTFGALIQKMIINDSSDADKILSGIGVIDLDGNIEFGYCIGLNSGITDGSLGVENGKFTKCGDDSGLRQSQMVTIDDEIGGLKLIGCNINMYLSYELIGFIKSELLVVRSKNPGVSNMIEFSILDYNSDNRKFVLLQNNVIF